MFTKMQKFHKIFLVSVTVLIAASFGMGTVMLNLADPEQREGIAYIGGETVRKFEFTNAEKEWGQLYRLALLLSPKARRIERTQDMLSTAERELDKDYPLKNYNALQRPAMEAVRAKLKEEMISQQLPREPYFFTREPFWDGVFSLRESVVKLDQKFWERLFSPEKQRKLFDEQLDLVREEFDFYAELTRPEIDALLRGELDRPDVWNFMLLRRLAEKAGIRVSQAEVDNFVADTRDMFGKNFEVVLEREKIKLSELAQAGRNALTILRYIDICYSAPPSMQLAYENYAGLRSRHSLIWARFDGSWDASSDEAYRRSRLEFYDEKRAENPEYFRLPASVDMECVFLKFEDMQPNAEEKAKAKTEAKAKQDKAQGIMAAIHAKVSSSSVEAPLEGLAEEEKLGYVRYEYLTEPEFLKAGTVRNETVREFVFKTLEPGQITPILAEEGKSCHFVRLLRRIPAQMLEREEVSRSDNLFLQCYHRNNRDSADYPYRLRLGFVLFDHQTLKDRMLVSSPLARSAFFDQYKDALYKGRKVSFAEVQGELEGRIENFAAVRELQNFFVLYEKCKNPAGTPAEYLFSVGSGHKEALSRGEVTEEFRGSFADKGYALSQSVKVETLSEKNDTKWVLADQVQRKFFFVKEDLEQLNVYSDSSKDADWGMVLDRMRPRMIAPESIRYVETPLLTQDEILVRNPSGDTKFRPALTAQAISEIQDSPRGKYFFKVLELKRFDPLLGFKENREAVKDHFVRAIALRRATRQAEEFRTRCAEGMKSLSRRDPQGRAEAIFRALAWEFQVPCGKSDDFEKTDEVPELKAARGLEAALKGPQKTTPTVAEPWCGSALVAHVLRSASPAFDEISRERLNSVRHYLWQYQTNLQLVGLIDIKGLEEEMKLVVYNRDYQPFPSLDKGRRRP